MNKQGFTLLELIVGLGIGTLLITLVALAFQNGWRILKIEETRSALYDETRVAVDTVASFSEEAAEILAEYTTDLGETYQTTNEQIVLSLPAYDANLQPILDATDILIFGLDQSNPKLLVLQIYPAASSRRAAVTKVLTTSVAEFQIRYYWPDSDDPDLADDEILNPADFASASRVEAKLTTETAVSGRIMTVTFVSSGRLRNMRE